MAIKRDLLTNVDAAQDPEAIQHGYRAMLAGMEYALKRILGELNHIRRVLGMDEVKVSGLGDGLNTSAQTGGITEEGRQKLRDMMKQRWQIAHQEGVHVTQL